MILEAKYCGYESPVEIISIHVNRRVWLRALQ